MALVLADRVRETTTTAGTGTITLLGAVPSCQSFAVVGNGNTTYYTIVAQSGTEWEVGIGTYTSSGTTLSRDTVLSSSNSGSLVNFSAGTKDVFVDYPASKAVYENAAGNVDGYPITGGTIDNTTIGATTPSTGVFTTLTATGQTSLGGVAGSESFRVNAVAGVTRYLNATGTASGDAVLFAEGPVGSSPAVAIYSRSTGLIKLGTRISNGSTTPTGTVQFQVSDTASAVNYVQVTGAATGSRPTISSQGSDASIGLTFQSKAYGTQEFVIASRRQFLVGYASGNTEVNYFGVQGSNTGMGLQFYAAGSDTNISQVFQSKGTGAIDLAAGSSGVNISNGGTVTAITRTAQGSAYTSTPSVVISAPTTAGGVQATAQALMIAFGNSPTITSGGTGYTVNDVLTVSGGTFASAVTITVTSVSGGVITGANYTNFGNYTVLPTNPVSVTGGTGSSATFTISWGVNAYTITNAGSGYVEQPTVTFSGGGGSGAAAYATVGATTTFRTIGHTGTVAMRFDVPSSLTNNIPAFRLIDAAASQDSGLQVVPSSGGAIMNAFGATNAYAGLFANGSGQVKIGSGGTGQTLQFNVTHTASAVNYVQVTGGATTTDAKISAQGSDASVGMSYSSKNGYFHRFWTNNFADQQFAVLHTASSANYATVKGGATGFGVVFGAAGSDTNIPAVVQPKGTGALQAQQTDSTATGGNARGANAVDWQTARATAAQVASGQWSAISGGVSNTVSATASNIGGGATNAVSNTFSGIFGGQNNTNTATYSFIGGGSSNTTGTNAYQNIVGGKSNTASGFFNFIGGGFTNSGTSASAVTTQSATMNGTTAVTLSGSNANIKVGQYILGTSIAGDTYVAAISGTSLTLSQAASGSSTSTLSFYTPHGVVVGGGNNQATGSYSFIGGGGDAGTAANRNVASGDWSTVSGGRKNTASGAGSFVGGGGFEGSSVAANTASGGGSLVVGGVNNIASAYLSSVLGGNFNIANSTYSFVLGGIVGITRSISGYAVLNSTNAITFGSGVSQVALLVLARQTTDATATVLTSDTNSANTQNQVILPNNSAYAFRGTVIANVTGGGNTKAWSIEGAIKRGANAASTALVGTPTVTSAYADVGAATWAITATADTTNGGLAITFTGQAGTTIRVVAKLETTEVTF